jgi:hypothetical protein
MAYGDKSDDSSTGKSTEQQWANINFKNVRHPDQSGSADMQRYFDDAEYVKDQYPSRTKIVGELLSGLAQYDRHQNNRSLDRDDQDDLLKSVAFILTGEASLDALHQHIADRAAEVEMEVIDEASEAEAEADD